MAVVNSFCCRSGWAEFQLKSDKEKKEWEAKRVASTGGEGSNKRKSSASGYMGFVSQSMEAQKKWHELNERALSKGQISKLPGVVSHRIVTLLALRIS
jgi:hypothetical protein